MSIAADDVRRLLGAGDTDAVLVLIEGHTEILSAQELTSPAYRGALRVASREEVIARTGRADLSDRELAEQAESLDVAVRNVGG
ncbi:MAG: hypothetical protein WA317_03740 [Mycobacterium sp.]|uniref:hypothetical protein n=1 Tax=Mycobacterium sp. TaxID=1785 RepID=UPI003CC54388